MIDEIINNTISKDGYDKESFKQRKREQLQSAYKMVDEGLDKIKSDPSFFKEYLDVQSRFDMYTPRNAILIATQQPTAMQLKTKKDWLDSKATFKQYYPKKITILEPGEPYKNIEGKKITPMYAKDVIDISETNVKPFVKNYDQRYVLQSLTHGCPATLKVVDNLGEGKLCEWDKDTNTVYILRNNDITETIKSLSKELAKAELYDNTSEINEVKAECISYMVCKKYGVDVSLENIDRLSSQFKDMENQDVANELTSMKEVVTDMNMRMGQYFDRPKNNEKNKEQER